jgi:hypothetical protein
LKRKQPPPEERRRKTAELNLLEDSKRLKVTRRGCASFFGSLLALAVAAAAFWAGLH